MVSKMVNDFEDLNAIAKNNIKSVSESGTDSENMCLSP